MHSLVSFKNASCALDAGETRIALVLKGLSPLEGIQTCEQNSERYLLTYKDRYMRNIGEPTVNKGHSTLRPGRAEKVIFVLFCFYFKHIWKDTMKA